MTAPTKAAVRKDDWDHFKLDGGSLVIYPRDGRSSSIPGWVAIEVREVPSASAPAHPARGPIKPKLEKAHG